MASVMKRALGRLSPTKLLFGTRTVGLATVGLAAAAGVFTGSELDLEMQTASPLLSQGVINFWPVVLGLVGLVLDVASAGVAVIGGGLMCFKLPSGRRFVVAALTAAIAGEVALAFVERGQFTQANSELWIALLLAGYLVLIVSALVQRRRYR
ncbi:MAG: hypothetical protein ACREOL_08380 [Candidatus Dormibacteria bacterium]